MIGKTEVAAIGCVMFCLFVLDMYQPNHYGMNDPIAIAREYFPELSDHELDNLIVEHTGWPIFWNIGVDGITPEECFRKQISEAKCKSAIESKPIAESEPGT